MRLEWAGWRSKAGVELVDEVAQAGAGRFSALRAVAELRDGFPGRRNGQAVQQEPAE